MSVASSEASLTVCSGTLRTSIGGGTCVPLSNGHYGADVVAGDGIGDVLQGRDHRSAWSVCGLASLHEAQCGLHLGAHRPPGELAGRGVLAQLGGGDAAE